MTGSRATQFLDPTAEPGVEVVPYDLAVSLTSDKVTLGLLANSFVDSEAFLAQVAQELELSHPTVEFRSWDKGSPKRASELITDEEAVAIRNACMGVITAYGH